MTQKMRSDKEAGATANLVGRFAPSWMQTSDGAAAMSDGTVAQSETGDTSPQGDHVPFDLTSSPAVDAPTDDVVENPVVSVLEADNVDSGTGTTAYTALAAAETAELDSDPTPYDGMQDFVRPGAGAIGELGAPAASVAGSSSGGFVYNEASPLPAAGFFVVADAQTGGTGPEAAVYVPDLPVPASPEAWSHNADGGTGDAVQGAAGAGVGQKIARWGTEFIVGTGPATGAPSVAALGVTGNLTGRFVIVYAQGTTDTADVGDTEGIVAQLYNSDGTPNGDPFLVNSTTAQIQIFPVVVDRVNDEGFAVAWKDFSSYPNGDGTAVRMRLFDVNGNASGNDFVVHDDSQDFVNQVDPSIDRIGTTGTIFVGFDTGSPPTGEGDLATGVRGRSYSNTTPLQGTDFAITNADPHAGENNFQAQVHITDLPSTGFLATWVDNLESGVVFGTGTHIRGRLYNQTGTTAIGTEFTIASNANAVLNNVATVGLQDDGIFVVAWTQDDDASSGGFERNIYARIFDGGTGGTPFLLHIGTAGQQDHVALAAYGPDKFVATWTHQDGPLVEIRARVFNSDGTPFSQEIVVNSLEDHAESLPSVAVLHEATGPRFVISWRDNSSSEIQAQIFDLTAGAQGIDFFGSARGETYTAQYDERVLHGNGGKDKLTGSDENDTINGGTGADEMRGGLGDDTYVVDNAGDKVFESANQGIDTVRSSISFSLGGQNLERLELTGSGNINGTGNSLNNRLTGNAGNNTLNGSSGADEMTGKAGNDTYVVDNAGDEVFESAGQGTDTVQSSVSFSLAGQNIERLELTGSANINGTGNGLANRLTGNAGNNTLNGGTGADEMRGLAGNDVYVVDNAGDTVFENTNQGTDTVRSLISFSLAGNFEQLELTGSANINGTGNGLANRLTGNAGNNTLNGGAGTDEMRGNAGNDIYIVDNVGDTVFESANQGTDTVRSSISFSLAGQNLERLELTGSANINGTGNGLANQLTGNAGKNILNGATGNDTLTGGAGIDFFQFDTALNASTNVDTVTDFQVNVDKIQLENAIFTAIGPSLTADEFVANANGAATNGLQHILYDTSDGRLFYDADGNGSQAKVHFATLSAGLALDNQDFLVI